MDEPFLAFEPRPDGIHVWAGTPGGIALGRNLSPAEARDTLARLQALIAQLPPGETP